MTRLAAQIAAEAGCSAHQARLAQLVAAAAAEGTTLATAAARIGRARITTQRLARRWIIDFADYRPFARRKERPAPIGRLTLSVEDHAPAGSLVLDAPAGAIPGASDRNRPIEDTRSGLPCTETGTLPCP